MKKVLVSFIIEVEEDANLDGLCDMVRGSDGWVKSFEKAIGECDVDVDSVEMEHADEEDDDEDDDEDEK